MPDKAKALKAEGKTQVEIAEELGVSQKTVQKDVDRKNVHSPQSHPL